MRFVVCTYNRHAGAILEIFNEAIRNTTALYDYKPRTAESVNDWFSVKARGRFPVIGAVGEDDRLLGFASYGIFRNWPAYKYTVEHSVYVHKDYRRGGIGRALMQRLIATARQQEYHVMVGGIDVSNTGSVALHEQLGFTYAGTIAQVAYKFGRWLDLAFYQLVLDTPRMPLDG